MMKRFRYDSPDLRVDLKDKIIRFTNCRSIKEGQVSNDDVWTENGKIICAKEVFYDRKRIADIQVDCDNLILAPGFIDIQINGGFGIDFSSLHDCEIVEKLLSFSEKLLKYGVTSFCPTFISSRTEFYHKAIPFVAEAKKRCRGSRILGSHLEGPFISSEKKGAHPEKNICLIEDDAESMLQKVYGELQSVSIVTLAPELIGALSMIEILRKRNIVVSIGHSVSSLKQAEEAVKFGVTCITHLFNAMKSFHHRDSGIIGLIASKNLSCKCLYFGVISDGIHTHNSALNIAYRTNPEGLLLVTDAIAAFGMGDGIHRLGDQVIICIGAHAFVEGTHVTAGSVSSMGSCIRHFMEATECSLADAVCAASLKPARLLGLDGTLGSLEIGRMADMVLIDENVGIYATYLNARLVYVSNDKF